MGWRWSMLEALWAACALFLVILFLLPETSHDHILLKRAQRIRRLTRDDRYVSEGELSQAKLTASQVVGEALIRKYMYHHGTLISKPPTDMYRPL